MKKSIKETNGITLVALVITIIILLILAGIAIASLTGDNGLFARARQAREETNQANAEEQVKLAVMASIGTKGKINTDDLNYNLERIEELTHNGDSITNNPIYGLPAKVVVDGNTVIINEDGSVVVSEWKQAGYEITNGKITVKVGDTVLNYEEGIENSIPIETSESGYTEQQNLTTENLGWKILGIGKNGGLELISDNPTTVKVTLQGETGYLQAEEVLNKTCNALYGKGIYAESARSLNVEDINILANYNPRTQNGYGNLWKYRFSIDTNYMQYSTSTDYGKEWSDWNNITNERYQTFRMPGSTETISVNNPKQSEAIERISYTYTISSNITNAEIANMITKGIGDNYREQWLASRAVGCSSNYAAFYVRCVSDGEVGCHHLYGSFGNSNTVSKFIRPVVTLQSDIQLEGNSEDGWTIKK